MPTQKKSEKKELDEIPQGDVSRTCFIIMPISDNDKYPSGHFGRVYEHIIKPACKIAGFIPIRADDVKTTNYIALDIVKQIIQSDMAICDLSGQNPNVLYEVGIRQAFDLPVTFMKDYCTKRIFDIQGFRDVAYDETLRIDSVEKSINELAITLTNTFENKGEVNSLVKLLGIKAAQASEISISQDTELILEAIKALGSRVANVERVKGAPKRLSVFNKVNISHTLPSDAVSLSVANVLALESGDYVFNRKYGNGRVNSSAYQDNTEHKISVNYGKHRIIHLVAPDKFYYSELMDELY